MPTNKLKKAVIYFIPFIVMYAFSPAANLEPNKLPITAVINKI